MLKSVEKCRKVQICVKRVESVDESVKNVGKSVKSVEKWRKFTKCRKV